MNKVQVLLSTYNGERFICEQVESLIKQTDVDLSLLVRDDGSSDRTLEMLEKYRKKIEIHIISGSNLGFAQSFWELVKLAGNADYYAFCDQDDYWLPDKLSTAIEMLSEYSDCPVLYTSNVIKVDKDLKVISHKGFEEEGVLSFPDSLKKSILPGCTFTFNSLLLIELQKFSGKMIAHDWTVYSIACAIGKVVYDSKPHILYRIHGNNTIGLDSKHQELKKKFHRFLHPSYPNARSDMARRIYSTYAEKIEANNRQICYALGHYREEKKYVKELLHCREYNRDIVFLFLLLAKKV